MQNNSEIRKSLVCYLKIIKALESIGYRFKGYGDVMWNRNFELFQFEFKDEKFTFKRINNDKKD